MLLTPIQAPVPRLQLAGTPFVGSTVLLSRNSPSRSGGGAAHTANIDTVEARPHQPAPSAATFGIDIGRARA